MLARIPGWIMALIVIALLLILLRALNVVQIHGSLSF